MQWPRGDHRPQPLRSRQVRRPSIDGSRPAPVGSAVDCDDTDYSVGIHTTNERRRFRQRRGAIRVVVKPRMRSSACGQSANDQQAFHSGRWDRPARICLNDRYAAYTVTSRRNGHGQQSAAAQTSGRMRRRTATGRGRVQTPRTLGSDGGHSDPVIARVGDCCCRTTRRRSLNNEGTQPSFSRTSSLRSAARVRGS